MGAISDFFKINAERFWNLIVDFFSNSGRIFNELRNNGFFGTFPGLLSSATIDPIEIGRRAQSSTSRIIDYFYIAACSAPLVYYIYFKFIKPGRQLKCSAEQKQITDEKQKIAPLVDEPRIEPEETAIVEKKQNVYLHKYFGENSPQNALETNRMVRNRAGGESLLSTFQADDESGLRKIKPSNDDFMKKFFKSDGSIKAFNNQLPAIQNTQEVEPKSEEIKEEKKQNLPKVIKNEDFLKNFFGSEFDTSKNPNEKIISEEATYSKITVDIKMGSEQKPSVTNYEPSSLPRALSSEDFAEKFFKSNSVSPVSEREHESLATPVMVPKAKEIARTKNETTMLDVAFSPSSESSFSTIELELDSGFVQDFSSGTFEQEIEPELKSEIKEENREQKNYRGKN